MLQVRQDVFCVYGKQCRVNYFFNPGEVDGSIVDKGMVTLHQQSQEGEARNKDGRMLKEFPRVARTI